MFSRQIVSLCLPLCGRLRLGLDHQIQCSLTLLGLFLLALPLLFTAKQLKHLQSSLRSVDLRLLVASGYRFAFLVRNSQLHQVWRPIFISWLNIGQWPPADILRHQGIPRAAIALLKVLSRVHSRAVQVLLFPCRVNHHVLHMVDQLVFARASPIAVVEVENGQETSNPAPTAAA